MYRPRWPLGRGVISSTGDQQGFTPLLHFVPAIPAPARAAQKVLLPALIPTVGDKTRCGHCLQKSRQLSPWSWNTPNRHLKAVMQYVMSNRAVHSPNVRRFEDSKYNTRTVRGLLCFPSKPPPQSIKRGSGPESSQSRTSLRSAAELQLASSTCQKQRGYAGFCQDTQKTLQPPLRRRSPTKGATAGTGASF